jgi:hypothetical protein
VTTPGQLPASQTAGPADGSPPGSCLNCGTLLAGAFCHQCGQAGDTRARPTLREVFADTWDEVIQLDGRVVRTLRLLLRRPGQLTLESARGRRASFVPPVKLYLWCSVLYFAAAAFSPDAGEESVVRVTGADSAVVAKGGRDSAAPDSLRRDSASWKQRLVDGSVRMRENPVAYQRAWLSNVPKLMFVLVPFYAAIVSLFFWGRRYPEHLHFALHLHAVLFLVLAVRELPTWIPAGTWRTVSTGVTKALLLIGMPLYSILAMRRVYQRGWGGTIARALGVGAVYGLIAGLALLALVFLTVAMLR